MGILVVKFGTEVLMSEDRLDKCLFSNAARQIKQLQEEGVQTVVVSSGSIQAGRERALKVKGDSSKLTTKGLAAIGSGLLMSKWSEAFDPHTGVGQFWLTYGNWENKGERMSIKNEVLDLLKNLYVPIINENDVVSDEEIRRYLQGIGENDQLARMVAELVKATKVLFLTSIGGVYEESLAINPSAKMFEVLDGSMLKRLSLFGTSDKGTGGMEAKIKEALLCAEQGMQVAIAGLTEDSILQFGRGQHVGTTIK